MKKEELLIGELSELIGVALSFDDNGACEVKVDGYELAMYYRADRDTWLVFSVIADGGVEELPRGTLVKALELGLCGEGVQGCHIGLSGNQLVLSSEISSCDLTAKDFAESLLGFSRKLTAVSQSFSAHDASAQPGDGAGFSPGFDNGFISV